MATATPNLGLTKPAVSDAADIAVLNGNFDKIDEKCNPALFAPAGYGLGTYGKVSSDFNTAINSGFYSMAGDGVINAPTAYPYFAYGNLLVESRMGALIKQTLFYGGYSAIRWSEDGGTTWKPLEYVNPPMQAGVEYRTTERHEGSAVYAKRVTHTFSGAIGTNDGVSTVKIPHGVSGLDRIVRCNARIPVPKYLLPYISSASGGITAMTGVDGTNISLRITNTTWTDYTFEFDIYYTK